MSAPYYADATTTVYAGDCIDVLRDLPDNSVDAVCTDPPYGLEFMGKAWDSPWKADGTVLSDPSSVGGFQDGNGGNPFSRSRVRFGIGAGFQAWCELWTSECLRVLKPGGHLLAFGGTRTWHRLACAVEDAGFEVRDSIAWLYGSGFPKSLDVSKAIDKAADYRLQAAMRRAAVEAVEEAGLVLPGNSRHDWTKAEHAPGDKWWTEFLKWLPTLATADRERIERIVVGKGYRIRRPSDVQITCLSDGEYDLTAPATDAAREWQGWGTALKPAFEPVVVARKPLTGTVAANVLAHGTGALNVDGCRVGVDGGCRRDTFTDKGENEVYGIGLDQATPAAAVAGLGRWPANVVLDESQAEALDEQSGELTSGANPTRRGSDKFRDAYGDFAGQEECTPARGVDVGGASRFFYTAKADASERPYYFRPTCECEDAWPTTSPVRATAATTAPASSSTSRSGSDTTGDPSPTATKSTTLTGTSRTTAPTTSSRSPRPTTSASTQDANSGMASGGSLADSAASSNGSVPLTGTSVAKDGPSMGGAARVTSRGWSATSVCGECGAPTRRESHATVKPLALMRWLVRLVTPPGGTVLEPFAGSGTTVEACILEGFRCIAIEREADYLPLIVQRINRRRDPVQAVKGAGGDGGLFDLLGEASA